MVPKPAGDRHANIMQVNDSVLPAEGLSQNLGQKSKLYLALIESAVREYHQIFYCCMVPEATRIQHDALNLNFNLDLDLNLNFSHHPSLITASLQGK